MTDATLSLVHTGVNRRPLQLTTLALGWTILLLGCGIIFRTYDMTLASPALEFARQIGTPFMLAEILVILWAFAWGFSLSDIWRQMNAFTRTLLLIFASTFWIGTAAYSKLPAFSIALTIGTIIHLLFAAALVTLARPADLRSLDRMAIIIAAGFAVFSVMIARAMMFATPADMTFVAKLGWQFSIPGFISVRLFGAVCGAFAALLVGITLIGAERGHDRLYQYVSITLLGTLTIWTGTRAALLGVGVALLVALVVFRLRPTWPVLLKLALCLGVAAIVGPALAPAHDSAFQLIATGDYASADNATGGRISLWAGTWHTFLTHPWFGLGAGANRWALPPEFFPHVQPHNIVLQFLINWGVIATICALALLAIATWKAHRVAMRVRTVVPFVIMLDCLLAMSLVEGVFHFARETMLIMACFGLVFAAGQPDAEPMQRLT